MKNLWILFLLVFVVGSTQAGWNTCHNPKFALYSHTPYAYMVRFRQKVYGDFDANLKEISEILKNPKIKIDLTLFKEFLLDGTVFYSKKLEAVKAFLKLLREVETSIKNNEMESFQYLKKCEFFFQQLGEMQSRISEQNNNLHNIFMIFSGKFKNPE